MFNYELVFIFIYTLYTITMYTVSIVDCSYLSVISCINYFSSSYKVAINYYSYTIKHN